MQNSLTRAARLLVPALAAALMASAAHAASNQRWYQIEVSIFTNESDDREMERWPPLDEPGIGFPDNLRRLRGWREALALPDWQMLQTASEQSDWPWPNAPQPSRDNDFKLPDPLRDPFVPLAASESDFIDTNRALENSPRHRLLYHAAWRQPMTQAEQAVPLAVTGGRQYGRRHELEGSLRAYFSPDQTRVLLDTDIWLSEFSRQPAELPADSPLPPLPDVLMGDDTVAWPANVTRIMPMRQSRPMRSNEFHYLDHPALGVVVQVFRYEPPAAPTPEPPTLPRLTIDP